MIELALAWEIAYSLGWIIAWGLYIYMYICVNIIIIVPTLIWECEIKKKCRTHYSVPTGMDAWKLIIYNDHSYCALYGKETNCSTAASMVHCTLLRFHYSVWNVGYSQVPHVSKEL